MFHFVVRYWRKCYVIRLLVTNRECVCDCNFVAYILRSEKYNGYITSCWSSEQQQQHAADHRRIILNEDAEISSSMTNYFSTNRKESFLSLSFTD